MNVKRYVVLFAIGFFINPLGAYASEMIDSPFDTPPRVISVRLMLDEEISEHKFGESIVGASLELANRLLGKLVNLQLAYEDPNSAERWESKPDEYQASPDDSLLLVDASDRGQALFGQICHELKPKDKEIVIAFAGDRLSEEESQTDSYLNQKSLPFGRHVLMRVRVEEFLENRNDSTFEFTYADRLMWIAVHIYVGVLEVFGVLIDSPELPTLISSEISPETLRKAAELVGLMEPQHGGNASLLVSDQTKNVMRLFHNYDFRAGPLSIPMETMNEYISLFSAPKKLAARYASIFALERALLDVKSVSRPDTLRAIDIVERLIALLPEELEEWVQEKKITLLAHQARLYERRDDAIAQLKELEKKDPNNPSVQLVLAQAYLWKHMFPMSYNYFTRLLEQTRGQDLGSDFFYATSMVALLATGDIKLAQEHIQKARESQLLGDPALEYVVMALILELERKDAEALVAMNQAISLNPTDSDSYTVRGLIRRRLDDISGAIQDFEKVVAMDPQDHGAKSWVLALQGHYKKALVEAEKGLDIDPEDMEARLVLAYIYKETNQRKKARALLTKLIEIFPYDPILQEWLAEINSDTDRN